MYKMHLHYDFKSEKCRLKVDPKGAGLVDFLLSCFITVQSSVHSFCSTHSLQTEFPIHSDLLIS